ncbi:COPI associated protein (macronuclear) [Tetrahymena thermophila SB210]|uniref:COPI associated protein n=1 Tax=Tetrahymena thermophila (strain SB210) TaxID=312017 RepID=I7LVK8_TETTS|nr:COPI associated protein [Tetrahymena thermophila SB210]EAR98420.2 COPI associated protein [Tetrahymena thermophila SB210]|eukprot:XP_001018665.2 COPI associated protein [Tetrahymena thermophila SB210]
MSSNAGKIIKIINICSSLVLSVAGVWRIVSLQIFKVLDTWYFFDFFMPFFMIILGIMLLVIEFKREFMEKYFLFLTTLLGRGIFNVFLSSMSVFAISDEFGTLLAPFIYSLILFVIGFFYILFSFFSVIQFYKRKQQIVSIIQCQINRKVNMMMSKKQIKKFTTILLDAN